MHAVEGMILGICAVAWVYTPLRTAFASVALLDEILLLPLGVSACLNLLACTLLPNNDPIQAAFFSLSLTLFLGYLLVAVEAQTSSQIGRVFFGGGFLYQVPAGVSLGLMAIQTLVAAGAVSHRLWRHTQWQEGALLLVSVLFACLYLRQKVFVAEASTLVCFAAVAMLSLNTTRVDAVGWRWFHLGAYTCLVAVSNALAYATNSTLWAHVTLTLFLWSLILARFCAVVDPVVSASVQSDEVEDAPLLAPAACYVAPHPPSLRTQCDAILFGGRPMLPRAGGVVKKHI